MVEYMYRYLIENEGKPWFNFFLDQGPVFTEVKISLFWVEPLSHLICERSFLRATALQAAQTTKEASKMVII